MGTSLVTIVGRIGNEIGEEGEGMAVFGGGKSPCTK